MIKRLRRKFIIVAMLAVVLVLGAIIAAVNAVNYQKIGSSAEAIIEVLLENNGKFSDTVGQTPVGGNSMTAETPYETRFFTVYMGGNGDVVDVNTSKIAAIGHDEAQSIAESAYSKNKSSGRSGNYIYGSSQKEGGTLYVFVDCSKDLGTFKSFLIWSVIISACGTLLVFVLVVIFSRIVFKPVEESYFKQRRFITDASHDIKTPLTVISADAEVIELESGESEWTTDIKKQIKRLTALTEKLVLLSRMEEENVLSFAEVDLTDIMREACADCESRAVARGISFKSDIAEGIKVTGNAEALAQAAALLLDNAFKYCISEISVTLASNASGAELTVANDANGVPEGNREEFFERFYRSDESRVSTGGHGIGLAVVRAVAQAHGGKTSAHSDGKTVEIKFSVKK